MKIWVLKRACNELFYSNNYAKDSSQGDWGRSVALMKHTIETLEGEK